jgi:hypothetical protein
MLEICNFSAFSCPEIRNCISVKTGIGFIFYIKCSFLSVVMFR